MSLDVDLIITNGHVLASTDASGALNVIHTDLAIKDGKIVSIGSLSGQVKSAKTLSAKGLHVLPGCIDTQVHFRDPGFPQKEDLKSGSRSAIKGGVTSFFDMPNTKPATLTALDLADKIHRAKGNSWANFAFYIGASPSNIDRLHELEKLPGACGVKMFMGSSTGNLVVSEISRVEQAVKTINRRMSVHAEDEDRLNERKKIVLENPGKVQLHPEWRDVESALIATRRITELAEKYKKRVHVLHVTSAEEVEFLRHHKNYVTFEITPQHLSLWAPECYDRLGTLAQMNPPIREKRHHEALWMAVKNNWVDVIGSDHAPHTIEEKKKIYPETPSGMTGVQTLLPILLDHCHHQRLSLQQVVRMTSHRPAEIFGIKNKGRIKVGYDADLVLVDLNKTVQIKNSWIESRCGWSPFDGHTVTGWPIATLVNGKICMRDDEILGSPAGEMIQFEN